MPLLRALTSSSNNTSRVAAAAAACGQHRGANLQCRAYADPAVYDIAFNFREFEKEVGLLLMTARGAVWECTACGCPARCLALHTASCQPTPPQAAHLLAMHQKHCKGAMGHFLEVACGPARHAALIARSAGAAAIALDLSPAMLDYARTQAEAAGVAASMQFVQADMARGERPRWLLRAAPASVGAPAEPARAC